MKKITILLMSLAVMAAFVLQAQIVDIHQFNSTTGAYPYGSLTLSGQILYGMTYEGGLYNEGCVFALDTNGNNYRDLYDFHDSMGIEPRGALLLANGFLYGMTTLGGSDNDGNIFRVDTGGNNYKNMVDFNHTNGGAPWGSLITLGGKLYGMTEGGGTNGEGVIFSVDTSGDNYNILFSFLDNDTVGGGPEGDLIFVNGRFYGMTEEGGQYLDGMLFSVDSNGHNFKDLVDFWGNIPPLGQYPKGSLTYANGVLYGMTEQGGADDLGVVFSVDTNGNNYTVLQDFTGANGEDPVGNLLLQGGTLYGMTEAGGANNEGLIFSIDTNGNNFTHVADFDGTNGGGPTGSLTLSNGILYGTTYQDAGGYGAVFSTNICNLRVSINGKVNVACYGGSTGQAVVTIAQGTSPYTFNWSGGAGTTDTVTDLSEGIYLVTVTDNNGCSSIASDTVTQPATALSAMANVQNVICFGGADGSIALAASGGTAPYTYTWTQIATLDSTHADLAAGNYSYTITDANHCTFTGSAAITQPATAITASFDSVPQTGQLCNGMASVTASGGISPYTYFWETGAQTTDTITGQCAGNYCCIITDNNGCADTACVTVNLGTGINWVDNSTVINVYPEPNDGYFIVEGTATGQIIELYDFSGQKLSSIVSGNTITHFDISDKANGMYLIRILSKDGNVAGQQKIIKAQ